MNKEQKEKLYEVYEILDQLRMEIDNNLGTLEKIFPNSERIDKLNVIYDILEDVCINLDNIILEE